jgi:hypothetical protein
LTRTEIFLKSGGEGKGEREEFTINDDPDVFSHIVDYYFIFNND